MTILNPQTLPLYAAKHYDNPHCESMDEFNVDLSRIQSIKKLLNRYVKKNDLRLRILLNHIVIFHNLFGEAACRILLFSCEREHYPTLKSIFTYLNIWPDDDLPEVQLSLIEMDFVIWTKLENL